MLLTFLSPGFGWQVVAGHELLSHPAAADDHPPHHDAGTHDNHHSYDLGGDHADHPPAHGHEHDHDDAHSMAGHVLSHMPATTFHAALPVYIPHQPVMQGAEPPLFLPQSPPEQPYRPPQTLLA